MESDRAPSNVVPYDLRRSRRKREVRSRTIGVNRITKSELRRVHLQLVDEGVDLDFERPKTRGDCANVPRPCPYAGCAYHLFLDVRATGSLTFVFPDLEDPSAMQAGESCALDVAERGGATLEAVGALMNITRERIRQLEGKAAKRFRAVAGARLSAELEDALVDAMNRPGDWRSGADPYATSGGALQSHDGKKRDAEGLTAKDRLEVERWTNEIAALMSEGMTLRQAQELALEPFDGPEDPPANVSSDVGEEESDPDRTADADESEEAGDDAAPAGRPGAATPLLEERASMAGGMSPAKAAEIEARKTAVLAYLKKHGPSSGPAIRETAASEMSRGGFGIFTRKLRDEGVIEMVGEKSHARYFLPGDKRAPADSVDAQVRKPSRVAVAPKRETPPTPKASTAIVKVAPEPVAESLSEVAARVDPVSFLVARKQAVLDGAQREAEKIDVAIRALGGETE